MQLRGQIVAVDLPSKRIERLRQNLDSLKSEHLRCTIVETDVTQLSEQTFAEHDLPATYDAVMLDAPCSNTGVIQRRTDVKWRLEKSDIDECAALQGRLLQRRQNSSNRADVSSTALAASKRPKTPPS